MKPDARRVINGTYGQVWVDGELWFEVDSFEAKVTINYEAITFPNDPAEYQKALGWSPDGKMTIKKIYSRVQRKLADAVRKGQYPRVKMVGKVSDPDAFGAERVALHDVTINEFNLLKFEQRTVGSEEIPFKFSDYEMIDQIAG